MWFTIKNQTIRQLIVCDKSAFKELFKTEKIKYSSNKQL